MSLTITLSKTGESKTEVKKSVFIGRCFHITSPEEAAGHLSEERRKYPDARHLCYAWVLGGDVSRQKSSDDGEPQGTAGQPLLELLTSNGFTDTLVCVTRYFGGTLLGKGGLKRAYTDSGRLALENGEPVLLIPALKWREHCSYPVFEMLSRKAGQSGWVIENTDYGQDVAFDIMVPVEDEKDIIRCCLDISGGILELKDPVEIMMTGGKITIS